MDEDKKEKMHNKGVKYCPNCGGELKDGIEIRSSVGYGGYDCWCEECDWSGDIMPDSMTDFDSNEAKQEKEDERYG